MDNTTGFAHIHIGSGDPPTLRYTSGLTLYDEALLGGRWIGRYWAGTGFVEPENNLHWVPGAAHTPSGIGGLDMAAFQLELDGQALHFGWELVAACDEPVARPGSRRAVVELKSRVRPVTVQVYTEVDGTGLLTRWLAITNTGTAPAALGAVWPLCGLVQRVKEWRALMGGDAPVFSVGYMNERIWGNEGAFEWQSLPNMPLRLESRTGKSGHGTPFFVLRNEATGEHIVGGLAWSGNWAVELTCDQRLVTPEAVLGLRMGPTNPAPQRLIAPGETVETPAAHLGVIQGDFDAAIQAWHRHLRQSVLRPEVPGRKGLVVYNHWSYTEHELSEEGLRFEIDVAADLGAEVFIVDAGWFGDRGARWWTTVGDWRCGDRLPNGLEPVFAYARQKGLVCGLWLDLERLGAESATAREHPEWLLRRYGQTTDGGDMDLTNPAAIAHLEAVLVRIIEQYQLELFRLDYNTYAWEGGQVARDGYQENTTWRYYENVYALYDRLRARYPHLMMENCSGGGGRTDIGLVSRFTHTWVTDWQIAPRTLRIVNGMSMALPPERIDRNAGVCQDGHERADLDLQLRSCMFGHFTLSGIYPAPGEGNPQHVARIRHAVTLYKTFIRPFLDTCRVYHHTPVILGREPQGWAVLEYVAEDRSRGMAGVFRLAGPGESTYALCFRGLDAGRRYEVTLDNTGQRYECPGSALLNEGLRIRLDRALTSELVLVRAVE
jgi:alpha-galactosidase